MDSKGKKDRLQRRKYITKISIVILCIIGVIILFKIFIVKNGNSLDALSDNIASAIEGEEGKVSTISKASLEKVFEISELSTAEYTYNAIARAYKEDGVTLKYYVAYEGIVKAGIDFSKIDIKIDEDEKIISITIPDVEIKERTVNPGTLEYIFIDKKSETETVHQEAYTICEQDLAGRIDEENDLLISAKENAAAVVKALVEPWVEQIDHEYTVKIQ